MQLIHKGQKEQCIHLVNVYHCGKTEGIFLRYAHPVGKVMGNIWSAGRDESLSKEVNMAVYKSMILHTPMECWKCQKKYIISILNAEKIRYIRSVQAYKKRHGWE